MKLSCTCENSSFMIWQWNTPRTPPCGRSPDAFRNPSNNRPILCRTACYGWGWGPGGCCWGCPGQERPVSSWRPAGNAAASSCLFSSLWHACSGTRSLPEAAWITRKDAWKRDGGQHPQSSVIHRSCSTSGLLFSARACRIAPHLDNFSLWQLPSFPEILAESLINRRFYKQIVRVENHDVLQWAREPD